MNIFLYLLSHHVIVFVKNWSIRFIQGSGDGSITYWLKARTLDKELHQLQLQLSIEKQDTDVIRTKYIYILYKSTNNFCPETIWSIE